MRRVSWRYDLDDYTARVISRARLRNSTFTTHLQGWISIGFFRKPTSLAHRTFFASSTGNTGHRILRNKYADDFAIGPLSSSLRASSPISFTPLLRNGLPFCISI